MKRKITIRKVEDVNRYLEIEETELDNEVSMHSVLFDIVATEYAKAIGRRDALKEDLRVLEAKLSNKLRRKYTEKDQKVTEVFLNNKVHSSDEYVSLSRTHLNASLEVELWGAKKESLRARTNMLTNASNLFLGGLKTNRTVKYKNVEEAAYRVTRTRLAKQRQEEEEDG